MATNVLESKASWCSGSFSSPLVPTMSDRTRASVRDVVNRMVEGGSYGLTRTDYIKTLSLWFLWFLGDLPNHVFILPTVKNTLWNLHHSPSMLLQAQPWGSTRFHWRICSKRQSLQLGAPLNATRINLFDIWVEARLITRVVMTTLDNWWRGQANKWGDRKNLLLAMWNDRFGRAFCVSTIQNWQLQRVQKRSEET